MKLRILLVHPIMLALLTLVMSALLACGPSTDTDQSVGNEPASTPTPTADRGTVAEPEQGSPSSNNGAAVKPRGVDVSHFQGAVAWDEVAAAGNSFAFAKATEGLDAFDSEFASNWQGIKAAGMLRGAYHFFRADDDGTEQARFFLSKVEFQANDMAVVDVELLDGVSSQQLLGRLRAFLQEVRQSTGRQAVIYTDINFWNALDAGDEFSDHPLWIAEYGVEEPKLPNGWNGWTFWQHSQTSTVPGITGDADSNVFNGTGAQLEDCFSSCGK